MLYGSLETLDPTSYAEWAESRPPQKSPNSLWPVTHEEYGSLMELEKGFSASAIIISIFLRFCKSEVLRRGKNVQTTK
jgi:hypothetical protein